MRRPETAAIMAVLFAAIPLKVGRELNLLLNIVLSSAYRRVVNAPVGK